MSFVPYGWSWPLGGEDPLFNPPFFDKNSGECSPLGVNEGMNIPPRVQVHPRGQLEDLISSPNGNCRSGNTSACLGNRWMLVWIPQGCKVFWENTAMLMCHFYGLFASSLRYKGIGNPQKWNIRVVLVVWRWPFVRTRYVCMGFRTKRVRAWDLRVVKIRAGSELNPRRVISFKVFRRFLRKTETLRQGDQMTFVKQSPKMKPCFLIAFFLHKGAWLHTASFCLAKIYKCKLI
jgi:hypothetical protein